MPQVKKAKYYYSPHLDPELRYDTTGIADRVMEVAEKAGRYLTADENELLGIHSYLAYLRDCLAVSRVLLAESGSVFVQISDENLHRVRALLDEVFGASAFLSVISFATTSGFDARTLATTGDFLLWYARDLAKVKYRQPFEPQETILGEANARWVLLPNRTDALTEV